MKVLQQLPLGSDAATHPIPPPWDGALPQELVPQETGCGHCCLPHSSYHQPPNQRCGCIWLGNSRSCAHTLAARETGKKMADIFNIGWPIHPDLPGTVSAFKLQVSHPGAPVVPVGTASFDGDGESAWWGREGIILQNAGRSHSEGPKRMENAHRIHYKKPERLRAWWSSGRNDTWLKARSRLCELAHSLSHGTLELWSTGIGNLQWFFPMMTSCRHSTVHRTVTQSSIAASGKPKWT